MAFFSSMMTGIEIDQGDYFDLVTLFTVLCTYELAELIVIMNHTYGDTQLRNYRAFDS